MEAKVSDHLCEKTIVVKVASTVPFCVIDDIGRVVGSANVVGELAVTICIDKHHPSALDLETDNGLAKLKLVAYVHDNVVDGSVTIGG
jgi:hypothetical protein